MPPLGPDEAKAEIARVFSAASATYGQVGPAYFTHFGERLVAHSRLDAGMRVLDVACGRGAVLFPAARAVGRAGHVTGVDLAEGMVAETNAEIQRRGVANASAQVMDAERLTFDDATFDAVLCGFALFFLPDGGDAALQEFRRVLHPGGQLALSTWAAERPPAEAARWTWFDDLVKARTPKAIADEPSLVRPFDTSDQLTARLTTAGFSAITIQTETVTFPYTTADEWWQAGWSHYFRRRLESLPPDALAALQAAGLARARAMRARGDLISEMTVHFTTATNPAS
jgi:ubiquinone/menaquinone biosynthesis C-methylase UbiE